MNYLPGLALNPDPPDLILLVAKIIEMSHQSLAYKFIFIQKIL
jgi:hypothetical protein